MQFYKLGPDRDLTILVYQNWATLQWMNVPNHAGHRSRLSLNWLTNFI
jgi:uncharacterized metal-binding protein